MKTIEEGAIEYAQSKSSAPVFVDAHISDFKAGAKFTQQWIDVNNELPPIETEVFVKVRLLAWVETNYSVAYLKRVPSHDLALTVWIIDGRHCTHHKNAINNCITHWRPIEYK